MKYHIFLPMFLILLLYACDNNNSQNTIQLRGFTSYDKPIVNANIEVHDLEGQLIHYEESDSNKHGAFTLHIPLIDIPSDFRITATGGTHGIDGSPFIGHLVAEVRMHSDDHGFYELNPVTTLISAYMGENPEVEYDEAVNKVLDFLNISSTVDPLNDLFRYEGAFDSDIFIKEAEIAGGLDNFIAQLVAEMESDDLFYCFGPNCSSDSVVLGGVSYGTAIGFLAKNLAAGAVSYVGGQSVGWILDQIIGSESDPDNPDNSEILSELEKQSQLLIEIRSSIKALNDNIKAAKDEILAAIDQSTYDAKVDAMPTVDIHTLMDTLIHLANTVPVESDYTSHKDYKTANDKYKQDVENFKERLKSADLETKLYTFHKELFGEAGSQGAIDLWGKMTTRKSLSGPATNQMPDLTQQLADQFSFYASYQLNVLTLLYENLHSDDTFSESKAEDYWQTYYANISKQRDVYLKWVAVHMAYAREIFDFEGQAWLINVDFEYEWGRFIPNTRPNFSPTMADALSLASQVAGESPTSRIYLYLPERQYNPVATPPGVRLCGYDDTPFFDLLKSTVLEYPLEMACYTGDPGSAKIYTADCTQSFKVAYPPAVGIPKNSHISEDPSAARYAICDFGQIPEEVCRLTTMNRQNDPTGHDLEVVNDLIHEDYYKPLLQLSEDGNAAMMIWGFRTVNCK